MAVIGTVVVADVLPRLDQLPLKHFFGVVYGALAISP